jgi:hypothetical protein
VRQTAGDFDVVRMIDISTGTVTTLAGKSGTLGYADGVGSSGSPGMKDGTGNEARFNIPWGMTSGGSNPYVCDAQNNDIRKIVISSGMVGTWVGKAGAGYQEGDISKARICSAFGICYKAGVFYFTQPYCVRKIR